MIHRLRKIFFAFTRTERIIFILTTALFVVSGAILAGVLIQQATKVVPARGGEFVEGVVGQPIDINPVIADREIDKSVIRLVFSSLNDIANKIEAEPGKQNRVWHVRLKENIRWSDGEKLTSDDVIFTIQKIQDPDTQSPLAANWRGVTADRLSELELQLTLASPYGFFQDDVKNLYVLPKHIFAGIPSANLRLSDYDRQPIGSGPYAFDSFEKQANGFIAAYHLKANPHFYGDAPLIPRFTFKFFSKTEETIDAFNAGTIDSLAFLNPQDLSIIKRSYQTVAFHLPNYYAVFLNQNKNLALKDPAVRQALTQAVDKNALVQKVFGGRATALNGPIPPTAAYADPEIASPTSSLEVASATLTEAGWTMGEQGNREKRVDKNNSLPLALTLTVPKVPFLIDTAMFLRDAWQNAGFKINLDIKPSEDIANTAIKNRDYQMILFGNVLNPSSDLLPFWHSSKRFDPGSNLSLLNDKTADALMESIEENLDASKLQGQFNKLQELIVSQTPAIFLYSPEYLYVANKNLEGVLGGSIAEPSDRFQNVANWYLKTTRVFK